MLWLTIGNRSYCGVIIKIFEIYIVFKCTTQPSTWNSVPGTIIPTLSTKPSSYKWGHAKKKCCENHKAQPMFISLSWLVLLLLLQCHGKHKLSDVQFYTALQHQRKQLQPTWEIRGQRLVKLISKEIFNREHLSTAGKVMIITDHGVISAGTQI